MSAAPITLDKAMTELQEGKSLAHLRGIDEKFLPIVGIAIKQMVSKGDYEMALAGCRFVCTHEHNKAEWWLLHGQVARAAKEHAASIVAFVTGLATNGDLNFCVEMVRTYLAAGQLALATETIANTKTAMAADTERYDNSLAKLESLVAEVGRRKAN